MYLFTVINAVADLTIIYLITSVVRTDDRSHPLAALVSVSIVPYAAHMYPTIMHFATAGAMRPLFELKDPIESFKVLLYRDRVFESIMFTSYLVFILLGGSLMAQCIATACRRNEIVTNCQITRRVLFPLMTGMFFGMFYYNNMFDTIPLKYHHRDMFAQNWPFILLPMFHLTFLFSLMTNGARINKITQMTENQKNLSTMFASLYLFAVITAVPLVYLEYRIFFPFPDAVSATSISSFSSFSSSSSHFMLSDYDYFIRLIVFASVLLLEPYNTRFRIRDRFYRSSTDSFPTSSTDVTPSSVQVVAPPLPKKTEMPDAPPHYEGETPLPLPTYEAAQTMGTQWGNDEKMTKNPITPIETH